MVLPDYPFIILVIVDFKVTSSSQSILVYVTLIQVRRRENEVVCCVVTILHKGLTQLYKLPTSGLKKG